MSHIFNQLLPIFRNLLYKVSNIYKNIQRQHKLPCHLVCTSVLYHWVVRHDSTARHLVGSNWSSPRDRIMSSRDPSASAPVLDEPTISGLWRTRFQFQTSVSTFHRLFFRFLALKSHQQYTAVKTRVVKQNSLSMERSELSCNFPPLKLKPNEPFTGKHWSPLKYHLKEMSMNKLYLFLFLNRNILHMIQSYNEFLI